MLLCAHTHTHTQCVCTVCVSEGYLHNLALVPENGIGVEIIGGVKPEVEPLFSVANSIHINIGLHKVGFPCGVAQELEIELIVIWAVR